MIEIVCLRSVSAADQCNLSVCYDSTIKGVRDAAVLPILDHLKRLSQFSSTPKAG